MNLTFFARFVFPSRLRAALVFSAAFFCSVAIAATEQTFDVVKFGAVGDGVTLNTEALQKAVDACHARGGGTVIFPAGRFLTGTLQLKDNVKLRLSEEAVLLGSTNAADYRNLDPFMAGDGVPLGDALIVAMNAKNVGIEGTGTIDGQGKALRAAQKPFKVRPFLIRWLRCTDVVVRDVHLHNPGAWTLNFFQSRNAVVERVTIRNRNNGLMNNDGIDLDSCENVQIRDCDIDSGDDAICLKATSALPTRNITVTNCDLSTKCNALKLGTESLGDFEDIQITNCRVRDTGMAGIALYSVDGAHLQRVMIDGITMDGVAVPISVRLGARLKTFRAGDEKKTPGELRDIVIKNVSATKVKRVGILINGVPGHSVERLALENIQMELPGGGSAEDALVQLPEKEAAYPEMSMFGRVIPAYGAYLRHVRAVSFKNVRLTTVKVDARPATVLIDAENVDTSDLVTSGTGDGSQPAPTPVSEAKSH